MTETFLLSLAGAVILLLLAIIAWFYQRDAARNRDDQAQMREEIRRLSTSDRELADRVRQLGDDLHTKYVPRSEYDQGITRLERLIDGVRHDVVGAIKALSDRLDKFIGSRE